MKIMQIANHKKDKSGTFIHHTADVVVEGPITSKEELIDKVSAEVGYHPHGYGIYGSKSVTEVVPGGYHVTWKTGASCD
jgi:hypothetical protein